MDPDNAALLARIEAFVLDDPDSPLTFSDRLARENHWPRPFARRVVAEYKRFAFLALAAGHPVTPSEEVDQAWHLHLCYTESYWQHFCKEVLGRPLHHSPTKGGPAEHAKHWDWYERTLTSYRRLFGEEPPGDIWTPAAERFQRADVVRIDRCTHWVIPKPPCWPWVRMAVVGLSIAFLVTGCEEVFSGRIPIFDLRGPQFLAFYVFFASAIFLGGSILRKCLRGPRRRLDVSELPQDPYAIACLARGAGAAVSVACASLAKRGLINVRSGGKITLVSEAVAPSDLHPLEREIVQKLGTGVVESPVATRARLKRFTDAMIDSLQENGFLLTPHARSGAVTQPLMLDLLAPLVGFIKIVVGLARGKPIGFLLVLTLVATAIVIVRYNNKPFRTRMGDDALDLLKKEHAKKAEPAFFSWKRTLAPDQFAFAVALFGIEVLLPTEYAPLAREFQPPPAAPRTGDSASDVSGCSGSSCSSGCGSSCGSGCGGCGGGGD